MKIMTTAIGKQLVTIKNKPYNSHFESECDTWHNNQMCRIFVQS